MSQIKLHKKIVALLEKDPVADNITAGIVLELINVNNDAKQYFYAKADAKWLDWLWGNSFLDIIKQKAEDSEEFTRYIPELDYLERMSAQVPDKVVNIILSVPIVKDSFNIIVVDRFLWICGNLPANQLKRVVQKIRDEKWSVILSISKHWGYEYQKMIETLIKAQEYESVLILAEAMLLVRPAKEIKESGGINENPFYFDDLHHLNIFKYLAAIDEKYVEQALALMTKTLGNVVKLGGSSDDPKRVFPIEETYYFFDVDFFALNLKDGNPISDRDTMRELAATVKILTERLIGNNCGNPKVVLRIFEDYINPLLGSRTIWRLRLFIMSLYPKIFEEYLTIAFNAIFDVIDQGKRYYEIESGTEYKKALKKSFGIFDDTYQRLYITNIFKYFGKAFDDKNEEKWHRRDGWQILSCICEYLTPQEKEQCEQVFGKTCDATFEPEPSIVPVRSGSISPQAPITKEEFANLEINDIATKLRNEWLPEALAKQNTSDNFFEPVNAEGVGGFLQADIPNRLQDYINNAQLFFDRDNLDQHYTYSFLRGAQDVLKNRDIKLLLEINFDELIALLLKIKQSGTEKTFDIEKRNRDASDAWLVSWNGVHIVMTDIVQELLNERNGSIVIDFIKYRNQLLDIIAYLLKHSEPLLKDEVKQVEQAESKKYGAGQYISDPFSEAINSVRGRAFQALTLFIYQDGKKFEGQEIKIDKDVKRLYELVLDKEKTRAVMFLFGHYLPSFYYRDRNWIKGLLSKIFPQEVAKLHLYTAAWEGFLANNVYKKLFIDQDIQDLYDRWLDFEYDNDDSKYKYFKDPDESIAVHFALAFMYYSDIFNFEHPLFKKFWEKGNVENHKEFIAFIGRVFVSANNSEFDILMEKDPNSKNRLKELWDWLLDNCHECKPFEEFGFWMNENQKGIFNSSWLADHIKRTLTKTKGILEWDYGLIKSIVKLANDAPVDTLAIVRLYLFEGGIKNKNVLRMPSYVEQEWFDTLKILYANQLTQQDTEKLIDDLNREGGQPFWHLEQILNN